MTKSRTLSCEVSTFYIYIYIYIYIRIIPIYSRDDPTKVVYHKLFIVRFISCTDWGSHPSLLKDLPGHPVQFCYYDYIEAWFRVILHQNGTTLIPGSLNLTRSTEAKFLHGSSDGGPCMAPS